MANKNQIICPDGDDFGSFVYDNDTCIACSFSEKCREEGRRLEAKRQKEINSWGNDKDDSGDLYGINDMDRRQLKQFIRDNDLCVKVTKGMDEDDIREEINDAIEEAKAPTPTEVIDKKTSKAPVLDDRQMRTSQFFSFLPTGLTRNCPFYPYSRMKEEQIIGNIEKQNSWGKCELYGYKLSLFDEEIMLAFLNLMMQDRSSAVTTTLHQICSILGKSPNKSVYNSIKKSIKRLSLSGYYLEIKEKNEPLAWRVSNFLTAEGFSKTSKIHVQIDPFFLEMYKKPRYTKLILQSRKDLKSDIAKALYRFFEGHDIHLKFDLVEVCKAINIETEGVRIAQLRRSINKALKELVEIKFLEFGRINIKDKIEWKKIPLKVRTAKLSGNSRPDQPYSDSQGPFTDMHYAVDFFELQWKDYLKFKGLNHQLETWGEADRKFCKHIVDHWNRKSKEYPLTECSDAAIANMPYAEQFFNLMFNFMRKRKTKTTYQLKWLANIHFTGDFLDYAIKTKEVRYCKSR